MKLVELKCGVDYAVRNRRYGAVSRLRMLAKEQVEVPFGTQRYGPQTRKQWVAVMAVVEGDYQPSSTSGLGRVAMSPGAGNVFVPGRDVVTEWDFYARGLAARERLVTKREGALRRIAVKRDALQRRCRALGIEPRILPIQDVMLAADASIVVSLDGMEALIELAEA